MLLIFVRAIFVLVVAGMGVRFARVVSEVNQHNGSVYGWLSFLAVLVIAVGIVIADLLTPRKRIQTISAL